MDLSIADLRRDYTLRRLSETDVDSDPFKQFQILFGDAVAAKLIEPNAMTLATATRNGKPLARIVLLKGFDERGFVFYTYYEIRKGQEIAETPWAALVFLWAELERQVRIEGRVEKCSAEESDTYFRSRPLGSRLGACVSQQSQVINSREILEYRLQELMTENANQDVLRPAYWGNTASARHPLSSGKGDRAVFIIAYATASLMIEAGSSSVYRFRRTSGGPASKGFLGILRGTRYMGDDKRSKY